MKNQCLFRAVQLLGLFDRNGHFTRMALTGFYNGVSLAG